MARSLRPELLVLDIQMPNLDGLQVLEALRAGQETSVLHVIVLSNSPVSSRRILRAFELGIIDWLMKLTTPPPALSLRVGQELHRLYPERWRATS